MSHHHRRRLSQSSHYHHQIVPIRVISIRAALSVTVVVHTTMSANDEKYSHAEVRQQMFASRVELQNYVVENAQQGHLQNIIDTIDKYGWTKQWMMNIGDRKGKILDQAIQTRKPKFVLELG